MPWDVERLAFPQMEALNEGAQERFNQTARLAAWIVEHIPVAVSQGIAMYMDAQKLSKKWNQRTLVRSIPGFRPLRDSEDDE